MRPRAVPKVEAALSAVGLTRYKAARLEELAGLKAALADGQIKKFRSRLSLD
jgi:hypothetical protein